jgi:hypothetical protein
MQFKTKSDIPFPSNFGSGFLAHGRCIFLAVLLFLHYQLKPRKHKVVNIDFGLLSRQLLQAMKMILL